MGAHRSTGLFATRSLARGDTVLAEEPVAALQSAVNAHPVLTQYTDLKARFRLEGFFGRMPVSAQGYTVDA